MPVTSPDGTEDVVPVAASTVLSELVSGIQLWEEDQIVTVELSVR